MFWINALIVFVVLLGIGSFIAAVWFEMPVLLIIAVGCLIFFMAG